MDSCISRTDHHNPLDIQITYTKLKYGITDLYRNGQFVSFYILNVSDYSSQIRESWLSTFPVVVKNEHFLKVKVKCYSKRMIPIEKYIDFT